MRSSAFAREEAARIAALDSWNLELLYDSDPVGQDDHPDDSDYVRHDTFKSMTSVAELCPDVFCNLKSQVLCSRDFLGRQRSSRTYSILVASFPMLWAQSAQLAGFTGLFMDDLTYVENCATGFTPSTSTRQCV
jgi:hypothetical protein